jgi:hypothetical protein
MSAPLGKQPPTEAIYEAIPAIVLEAADGLSVHYSLSTSTASITHALPDGVEASPYRIGAMYTMALTLSSGKVVRGENLVVQGSSVKSGKVTLHLRGRRDSIQIVTKPRTSINLKAARNEYSYE